MAAILAADYPTKELLELALPVGARVRLEAYVRAAARLGLLYKAGTWSAPVCLASVAQTVGFAGLPRSPCVGALIKNSFLVDLVSRRPLLPLGHFAVQGYLSPGCSSELVPDMWVPFFPCAEILGDLSDSDVRHLTGNSMSMVALSAWLTHALAAAVPTRPLGQKPTC